MKRIAKFACAQVAVCLEVQGSWIDGASASTHASHQAYANWAAGLSLMPVLRFRGLRWQEAGCRVNVSQGNNTRCSEA